MRELSRRMPIRSAFGVRSNAQSLLEHLDEVGRDRARHRPAHIRGVHEGPGEAEEFPIPEDRPHEVDVHDMRDKAGRTERIVRDQDVARLQRGTIEGIDEPGNGLPGTGRHAGHHRVGKELARRLRHSDLEILRLLDEGRVRRAVGDGRSLLGYCREAVLHDLGQDGIHDQKSFPSSMSP
jgi:hypothetical protein